MVRQIGWECCGQRQAKCKELARPAGMLVSMPFAIGPGTRLMAIKCRTWWFSGRIGRKGCTGLDSNIRGGVFGWSSFEEFHGARMTEITAVSIVSTCSDAIMLSGVAWGGFSLSLGIPGDDAYMRKEKRPWLLAKRFRETLEKKKKGYPGSEWHCFCWRDSGYQWMEHRGHDEWLRHTERKVAGAGCCI